jgi:hypothetical protein
VTSQNADITVPLTFALPVIAKPPVPTQPEVAAYYAAATTNTQLTAVSAGDDVSIKLSAQSPPEYIVAQAFCYGLLGHDPTYPDTLILQIAPLVISQLRERLGPGYSVPEFVIYRHIDISTVKATLLPWVKEFNPAILRAATQLGANATADALANAYLDLFLNGNATVLVDGGLPMGNVAAAPSSDYELIMQFQFKGLALSPVVLLRNIAKYDGEIWTGHPLIRALDAVETPIGIYASFTVYNVAADTFETLPAGVAVDLMDYDPLSPSDLIATAVTDAAGRVHFGFASQADLNDHAGVLEGQGPDLFFVVHTNEIAFAGHPQLPMSWSSLGWSTTNGTPGNQPGFKSTSWGTVEEPLIFRIGVDFHVQVMLEKNDGTLKPVPRGIPIQARRRSLANIDFEVGPQSATDEHGCLEGFTFNFDPHDHLYFQIDFKIENPAIGLPKTKVFRGSLGNQTWDFNNTDTRNRIKIEQSSIGTKANPFRLNSADERKNAAFFVMAVISEWSQFLSFMTKNAWTGVEQLSITLYALGKRSYSWPIASVNFLEEDIWDRSTILHELTHQAVWQSIDFGSWQIFIDYVGDPFFAYHHPLLFANPEHALAEGWPAFIAQVFEPSASLWSITQVEKDEQWVGFSTLPANAGESVEGALAAAFATIFWRYVMQSPSTGSIATSTNGDLTSLAPSLFMDATAPDRFLEMFWNPLQEMKKTSHPSLSAIIEEMRKSPNFPSVVSDLHSYRMAYPEITEISPDSGPQAGGSSVSIVGSRFDLGAQVTFGGTSAVNAFVIGDGHIIAMTPAGAAGTVDVDVVTISGKTTGRYTYV